MFSQLNLLKRLLSLTGPKFSSSSSARSAGERPIMIDREIRVMAMVSLLAVFVDIVP
jgi:nucleolar complex protein 3